MSSRITLTIGILPPSGTPLFTTRTVRYTDLSVPLSSLTGVLTTPPFLQYLPVSEPPPEEEPVPPV